MKRFSRRQITIFGAGLGLTVLAGGLSYLWPRRILKSALISKKQLNPADLRQALLSGQMTVSRLASELFTKIEKIDPRIHAYISVNREVLESRARALDALPQDQKQNLSLFGLPIALKDDLQTTEWPTSLGSGACRDWHPAADATVVKRLREAGALLVGKTNLNEFTWGGDGMNSAFGRVRNPLDPTRISAGSSSGSAAAVAIGLASIAIGSDASGSVLAPAAACGIFGYRSSIGRISKEGLVPMVPLKEVIGVLSRSFVDTAKLVQVISGPDSADPLTASAPPWHPPDFNLEVKSLRIGYCANSDGGPEGFGANVHSALRERLTMQGAQLTSITVPDVVAIDKACHAINTFEFVENIKKFIARARPDLSFEQAAAQFSPSVTWHLKAAATSTTLTNDYETAVHVVRPRVSLAFQKLFESHDFLALPTLTAAPMIAPKKATHVDLNFRSSVFDLARHAQIPGLIGFPAISVPIGTEAGGLSVGLMIIAKPFDDERLLAFGHAISKLKNIS